MDVGKLTTTTCPTPESEVASGDPYLLCRELLRLVRPLVHDGDQVAHVEPSGRHEVAGPGQGHGDASLPAPSHLRPAVRFHGPE